MSQEEGSGPGPRPPPTGAGDLWAGDVDERVGEVTAVSETVEVLADLVSDPARAALVAERLEALEAKVAAAAVRSRAAGLPVRLEGLRPVL